LKIFVLLPILSCVAYCVLATVMLLRDSRHAAHRTAALLCAAGAHWALCEALWNSAHDAEAALLLVRLSSLGWVTIGPIALHLFLIVTNHPFLRRPWVMPSLYGLAGVCVLLSLATPWVNPTVVQADWGWGYTIGPLFPAPYLLTSCALCAGGVVAVRDIRSTRSSAERGQVYLIVAGIALPLVIATLTDGVLPAMGRVVPRLGTTAIALLVGAIAWSFHRYGYSLMAPGAFASHILTTLADGVALLRPDGRIRIANPGMERLLGANPGTLEGRSMVDLLEGIEFDPAEGLREQETHLRSLVGDAVPVSVSTSQLYDRRQSRIGLVLVARDLREIASLRNRLVVSDRLAAVGQLAAGIAHEINNPMAYVRANLCAMGSLLDTVHAKLSAELVHELDAELEEGRELVDESVDGVDRVAAIVRDVKDFSHAGGGKDERIGLQPLLEAVVRVATPQLPAGCPIERRYAEIPEVRGSSQELKQVFLNLIINAFQSIDGEGAIRVSTAYEAGWVLVYIEDEGCGIPADAIERIFDPFYTTKLVGEGTGLGLTISYQIVRLTISYQIVRNHGGEITVDSEPGVGTTFRVALPELSEAI
jgi:PAS domain S-box-containing protein